MTAPGQQRVDPWDAYWLTVGSEQYLAARELVELSSRLRTLFASFVRWVEPDPSWYEAGEQLPPGSWELDWETATTYALTKAGLSGGERRLAAVVAALTTAGHTVQLDSLSIDGSWTQSMWRVLVEWGTDGALTVTGGRGDTPAKRAARRVSTTASADPNAAPATDRGGL
ncbi:hypothetical protein ACPPVT_14420 [Angustibacter sp. McL0619]|uniref:hypothetical protein n=1 Tax=Angustibacter sp. McL0619 TaxID=3415676 RepID=UPI003CF25674